jgi:hypothetical protein
MVLAEGGRRTRRTPRPFPQASARVIHWRDRTSRGRTWIAGQAGVPTEMSGATEGTLMSGTDEDLAILDEQSPLVCWFLPESEGRAVEDIIKHFGDRRPPSKPERALQRD